MAKTTIDLPFSPEDVINGTVKEAKQDAALQDIRRALAFGISAIKSREKWSGDAEICFGKAFASLSALENVLGEAVVRVIAEQAEDDGLWFQAQTAPEAYLQKALRRLHAAIEGDAKVLNILERK